MAVHIVCGLHRSGTTYVGKLLQQAGVVVVHEPLNERFGMRDVPIAYPYVDDADNEYASLLDDAVNFRRAWNKDVTYIKAQGLRRKMYQILGGRSGVRWDMLRLKSLLHFMPSQVCLKDPFMSLATPYLVKQHQLKVVCMVRHPAAIHYSTAKQGWWFDIQNLRKQSKLVSRFAMDVTDEQWKMAEKHAAASIGILWKVMVRINQELEKEDDELKIIKHEDLCLFPMETVKQICVHLGVPVTLELESFVAIHSQGDKAEAEGGKTHDFKRDSKALVDDWRDKILPEDEAILMGIVGDDVRVFYGCW